MKDIYLLIGGNIGDRLYNLAMSRNLIEKKAGEIIKKSLIYETAAWGFTQQQAFLNQVICIDSPFAAQGLLQELLNIELELGRKRIEKMGPRVIDIDILFYGNQIISSSRLTVPHPRITERRFVLTPLNEIAPDFIHPVYNKTIKELLQQCADELEVSVFASA